ncbi:PREDICTED: uncharacterized protein LOC109233757 [Nicotiana attenuata]|uniref:Avr9/Cf-9 rapidly elicited protein 146 n=1 Tax=Nicotiana attenuata TaxID=49451 RepID=A0A1J6ICB6_NICAT|nr:PREDICTED: uncharacterized protein LOC109233757 [Nicotiana attenuata]OIS98143.1 hypothetical protein A4A49_05935 [Nicotiana attenuata]
MEIEASAPQLVAKKLWKVVRIVFYMLTKGLSKSKLILDIQNSLQDMFKRGKTAGKAISNLMLHHQYSSSFTCKSNDVAMSSFVTRREYEFSCSNSPNFPLYFANKRRRNYRYKPEEIGVVQKVFEMLNTTTTNYDQAVVASPLALPGFGKSPMVRQLRITDSPFPLKDSEENINSQVDKDAEEFIKNFYKDLKQQKRVAAFESPSPYHICARN